MLNRVFGKEGYVTDECGNGDVAAEKLKASRYDIVICDINHPGLGTDRLLLEYINVKDDRPLVVVISGSLDKKQGAIVKKEKCFAVFPKPFDVTKFIEVFKTAKRVLEEKRKAGRMNIGMNDLQKWLIIGAIWIIAVALLLGAFRGRYVISSGSLPVAIDSWTGSAYNPMPKIRK